jgi:hypothetical protein
MILAVTITFWTILVLSVINIIAYTFLGYNKESPMWGKVLNIFWAVWLMFVMLFSLGII